MRTITELFRKARGDFRDEPAQLMYKRSILDRRLDHAEEAAGRSRRLQEARKSRGIKDAGRLDVVRSICQ